MQPKDKFVGRGAAQQGGGRGVSPLGHHRKGQLE
jgi:hypothetical protein